MGIFNLENHSKRAQIPKFSRLRRAFSAPPGPAGPSGPEPKPPTLPPPRTQVTAPKSLEPKSPTPPPHPPVGVKRYVPVCLRFQHPMLRCVPRLRRCALQGVERRGHVGSILKHVPDILIFVDVECQITMSDTFCVRGLGLAPGALGVRSASFPANL